MPIALPKDSGRFFHAHIALAEKFASRFAGKFELQKSFGGVVADVARGDLRDGQIAFQQSADGAHVLNDFYLHQIVFHKLGRTQNQRVQIRDPLNFLLEGMEAVDRADSFRFIRADTAQANGVRSAGFFDCGCKGIRDAFLIAAKIFGGDDRVETMA